VVAVAKGENIMNISTPIPEPVTTAIDELVGSLMVDESFIVYQRAKAAMDESATTQMLLKQYAEAQANYRQQQMNGSLTQNHIDGIRQLQQQVQSDPYVAAFVVAQFPVRGLLDGLTDELSSHLGFDFASFANVSSC
jgi:cell fate (sporulation/competence/biofilm development) regulator YlbF (YheA/YmcA/DUF963 family)